MFSKSFGSLNSNIIVHTYTATFVGNSTSTTFRISNEIEIISVQNYLGEMCVCNIIRYYAFWDSENNHWIRIYLNQPYTGNIVIKIVGIKKYVSQPL